MKFIVQLEILFFVFNVQLVKSQLLYNSSGTIYVKHGNETVSQEPPKQNEGQNQQTQQETQPETTEFPEPDDDYSYVAIIEIMFNDGSIKYCTGTIIYNNVLITAAHCFKSEHGNTVLPELTGSFVIIGTKRMFDTGYEKYLPIEQVLAHPDYKGMNSDLALIYTFAGMMSDKPGDIIPLADEKSLTTFYGNVSVLHWNKNKSQNKKVPLLEMECSESEEKSTNLDLVYAENNEFKHPTANINDKNEEVSQERFLLMEDYAILETDICKNLVDKLISDHNQIENVNKTLCFLKKHSDKEQRNSSAPVVYQNRLVAIASRNLNYNGDDIIFATKLHCYCTWIRDNLPSDGEQFQCCSNCCTEPSPQPKEDVIF